MQVGSRFRRVYGGIGAAVGIPILIGNCWAGGSELYQDPIGWPLMGSGIVMASTIKSIWFGALWPLTVGHVVQSYRTRNTNRLAGVFVPLASFDRRTERIQKFKNAFPFVFAS